MASNSDARKRAQSHFTASAQRDASIFAELARTKSATDTKTAKLKALRLAKEEEDRVEAARLAAEAPVKPIKAKRAAPKATLKAAPKAGANTTGKAASKPAVKTAAKAAPKSVPVAG